MSAINLARLSHDPLLPGRWWLSLPHSEPLPEWLDELALKSQRKWPGKVAVLDAAAVLISNLRVWENIVLPRWHHENLPLKAYEDVLSDACDLAGLSSEQSEKLVGRLPAMLDRSERRLVILLRAILMAPVCVLMEEDLWRDLVTKADESPHARLLQRLLQSSCVAVCGHSAAMAGFSPITLSDQEEDA